MGKNNKIIYIHSRPYPYNVRFYEEFSDYYFSFGEGHLYIKHMDFDSLKIHFEFEVWRGEVGIKDVREKVVNNTLCRIFPAKFYRIGKVISFPLLREIKKEKKKNNILIHYTTGPHTRELYLILMMNKDIPIFISHQGGANPLWKVKNLKKYILLLDYLLAKNVYKNADLFFTTSNKEADYLVKMTCEDKVILGPHWGVDLSLMKSYPKEKARKELGLDLKKKIVFVAGALNPYRGIKEAIEVVRNLKNEFNIELLNVGSSPKDADYAFAKEHGVKLIGRVAYEILYKYFSAADVYLYLTIGKMNEDFAGTGIAVLESLACNTPVVANTLHNYRNINMKQVGIYVINIEQAYKAIKKTFLNPNMFGNTRWIIEKYFAWNSIVNNILRKYYSAFKKYYNIDDNSKS